MKASDNLPLVTIITSVYNDAKGLEQAINSIRNQQYQNLEYVVVDGGSTDGTVDLIMQSQDVINTWISEKDTGIYNAWNKGLKLAKGEWIGFLGADDELKPDAVDKMITAYLYVGGDIDYISGRTDLYSDNNYIKTTGGPFEWSKFRKYVCTGHNAALHNKTFFEKYGAYDESFRSASDYEMLLRAGAGLKTLYVDSVTSRMNLGGASNNSVKAIFEAYSVRKRHKANPFIVELAILAKSYVTFYVKKWLVK